MSREFEIRREVELPATPEEVWEAVATAAGNEAWLFPNEMPDPDGTTNASGTAVTAWEPPQHFAVRTEQGDWFNALEYVIEGRAGGTTLLRYVHSGVFVDDWDSQYDAVNQHTDFYLHTLAQYLQHFAGRTATYVGDVPGGIQGPPASAQPGAFERLTRALGVPEGSREGDSVRVAADGMEPLDGAIDYLRPNFMGIRTADGLYRFFGRNAFGGPVGVSLHLFRDGVDADETKRAWQGWLDEVYAT
jgi:uncharacterized protein YndB with AHSA1/START domain